MATRKTTTKRSAALKTTPKTALKRRRRTAVSPRKKGSSANVFNFLVPFVFILVILGILGFVSVKGFQTVAASSFFEVKKIDIRGNSRVSRDEVEKIVRQQSGRSGVWNTELEQLKAEIEKLGFVRNAVVSRLLPDGILVQIDERIPRAVIRSNNGDFWVDDDGLIIGRVEKNEIRSPFLRGWEEAKGEKAQKDNKERIKIFLRAQEEFKELGIEKRVIAVNLLDLQDVKAIVEDSGEAVSVKLGKEDFGKRLQRALPFVEGKGVEVEELTSYGGYVSATPRKNQNSGS